MYQNMVTFHLFILQTDSQFLILMNSPPYRAYTDMHKLYSIQQSPVTIIYSTSHAMIVMGRGIVMVSSKGQRQNSIIHSKSSPQAATNTPLLIKYFKISSFYHFQDHNTFRNLCIFYEYYLLLKCVFENFLDNEH